MYECVEHKCKYHREHSALNTNEGKAFISKVVGCYEVGTSRITRKDITWDRNYLRFQFMKTHTTFYPVQEGDVEKGGKWNFTKLAVGADSPSYGNGLRYVSVSTPRNGDTVIQSYPGDWAFGPYVRKALSKEYPDISAVVGCYGTGRSKGSGSEYIQISWEENEKQFTWKHHVYNVGNDEWQKTEFTSTLTPHKGFLGNDCVSVSAQTGDKTYEWESGKVSLSGQGGKVYTPNAAPCGDLDGWCYVDDGNKRLFNHGPINLGKSNSPKK